MHAVPNPGIGVFDITDGELDLSTNEGDKLFKNSQIIKAVYDEAADAYKIEYSKVNSWPDGHTGTEILAEGEILVAISTGATVRSDEFSGAKRIARGLVAGDWIELSEGTIKFLKSAPEASDEPVKNNLALGKEYIISEQFRMSTETWSYDDAYPVVYPDDNYELTDGMIPEPFYSESGWMAFNQNTPAQQQRGYAFIQIDLGTLCNISSVALTTLKQSSAGITCPYVLEYLVSQNGDEWFWAGSLDISSDLDSLADWTHVLESELNVSARYVEVRIYSYGWAFLGELEIYGATAGDEPETQKTYENTLTIDENGNYTCEVPYGYTWNIHYVDGKISGEDATLCTTQDAYESCNPNWAITLYLQKQEDGTYVALRDAIVCPGSWAGADIYIGEDQVALVVHSAYSYPNDGYENWLSKVVAMSVREGDVFVIDFNSLTAYAVIPGEEFLPPNPDYEYEIVNGEVTINRYIGADSDVVIPDMIEGYPVTTIGDGAFEWCSLTSVVIPEGVTSIGNDAFYNCDYLESVEIPNSVTSIGDYAFSSCDCLASVEIPNSVTSIGDYAFSNCACLASVVLPDSVTSIGYSAFSNCDSLTSIVIPANVASIGNSAFSDCFSLTSIVVAEGNNTYYSSNNCIIEKESGKLIQGCGNSIIPDGVTSIGDYAFYSCNNLTSITIPGSVTSIGEYAFEWCGYLTSVTLCNGIVSIGSGAFSECYRLKTMIIPASVEYIGGGAFTNYRSGTSFSDIYCEAESKPDGWEDYWAYEGQTNIHWGYFTAEEYPDFAFQRQDSGLILVGYTGNGGDVVIPDTVGGYPVTAIADRVFYNCDSLTTIVIPDSVTSIGKYAFYSCYSLTSIVIPDSVTSIGNSAFSGCCYLTTVKLPANLVSLGNSAFWECYLLTSIEIPDGVTVIEEETFWNCYSLASVKLPDGLCSIGSRAFYSCESLTNITIPESVTSIRENAFDHCTAMTDIYCGATSRPADWDILWRGFCKATVHWGACTHSQVETIAVGATCTTDGYQIISCTACGKELSRKIFPAVNHDYQNGSCTLCGHVITDEFGVEIAVKGNNASAGSTVTVDIVLNKNVGLTYLNLLLDYDTDALELVSVSNGVLIDNFAQDFCMVWADAYNMTETGVLATLVFAVKKDAKAGNYDVTVRCIECCDETESDVLVGVTSGTVCVSDVVYGDCNGDGVVNGRDATRLLQYVANFDVSTGTSSIAISGGADCNGDGVVNGRDVTRLLRYLASYNPFTGESDVQLGA